MALLALVDNNPVACLLWLGAAMMIDGIDGTLARKYEVKSVLPHFDGSTLDMVIDYLTWAFIPALFIYYFQRAHVRPTKRSTCKPPLPTGRARRS